MPKYRKKPVIIEAIQWDGKSQKKLLEFLGDTRLQQTCTISMDKTLEIHTLEGIMKANVNDWIIKGVKGELYPCKPDIFEVTYELVAEVI